MFLLVNHPVTCNWSLDHVIHVPSPYQPYSTPHVRVWWALDFRHSRHQLMQGQPNLGWRKGALKFGEIGPVEVAHWKFLTLALLCNYLDVTLSVNPADRFSLARFPCYVFCISQTDVMTNREISWVWWWTGWSLAHFLPKSFTWTGDDPSHR